MINSFPALDSVSQACAVYQTSKDLILDFIHWQALTCQVRPNILHTVTELASVFRKWMATSPSLHQPVHFSFFCLGSGSRCTEPWMALCTAEACRICSRLPKQRCWRISERPHCTERKWMSRTLILEGWHSWHAVLGDTLFAELLTLHGPLFQAASVSYHLFYFPVSWFAFRNPHCSRKGKSITRFSGKILWNVFSFSQLCMHVLLSFLFIYPHSLVWWHFWKPTRDGGKI